MKSIRLFLPVFLLVIIAAVLFSSCNRSKLKINEERARTELIPIEQAKKYQEQFLSNYSELKRLVKDSNFIKSRFNIPNAETFNRDMIGFLLNQPDADGLRVYYGADEKGQIRLVFLPVDKNGNDIPTNYAFEKVLNVPGVSKASAAGDQGGVAGENGQGCPACTINN